MAKHIQVSCEEGNMWKLILRCLGAIVFLLAGARFAPAQSVAANFNMGDPTGAQIASIGSMTLTLNSNGSITANLSANTGGIPFFAFNVVGGRPLKKKCWQTEDYRMGIFDAAASGVAYFVR
jgi:hypothetical protein